MYIGNYNSQAFELRGTDALFDYLIERVDLSDFQHELNMASNLEVIQNVIASRNRAYVLRQGSTDYLNVNTVVQQLEIGTDIAVKSGLTLRGSTTWPDESEILGNAYFDGTEYRRKVGGNAFRLYMSGGSLNMFRAMGDAEDTIINWGSSIATFGESSITSGGDLFVDDRLMLNNLLPAGATQVASGASSTQLWRTAGHASLPDNVVMIGV